MATTVKAKGVDISREKSTYTFIFSEHKDEIWSCKTKEECIDLIKNLLKEGGIDQTPGSRKLVMQLESKKTLLDVWNRLTNAILAGNGLEVVITR